MKKKTWFLCILVLVLLVIIPAGLSAQASITRFAVVDMNRILAIYTDRMPEFRAFAEKREKFQAEVEMQTNELQELQAKLAEAQENGNKSQINNLEKQVQAKTQALQTYVTKNMAELEKEREQLLKNQALMNQINGIIRAVAESEGVSMVLAKDNPGVIWYSPSVDITNKVIERIRTRR